MCVIPLGAPYFLEVYRLSDHPSQLGLAPIVNGHLRVRGFGQLKVRTLPTLSRPSAAHLLGCQLRASGAIRRQCFEVDYANG